MKNKTGELSPVMESVLVNALKLWPAEFIAELTKMKAEGKQPMFHENWTSLMLMEFGIQFGINELTDTKYVTE